MILRWLLRLLGIDLNGVDAGLDESLALIDYTIYDTEETP